MNIRDMSKHVAHILSSTLPVTLSEMNGTRPPFLLTVSRISETSELSSLAGTGSEEEEQVIFKYFNNNHHIPQHSNNLCKFNTLYVTVANIVSVIWGDPFQPSSRPLSPVSKRSPSANHLSRLSLGHAHCRS